MFFGLPWSFTTYTITDEIITTDSGLLRKDENDCYLYKVIDVRLETTLMERILGIGTIHCFTGDVTDPDLKLQHIKNAKEIKDLFRSKIRVAPTIRFEPAEYISQIQMPPMSRKSIKFFDLR